jgi:glyoxylase-like metal-dependent hydrolase (beta-lactamase superfamily II)
LKRRCAGRDISRPFVHRCRGCRPGSGHGNFEYGGGAARSVSGQSVLFRRLSRGVQEFVSPFAQLVSQSEFRQGDICLDPMEFEHWLHKEASYSRMADDIPFDKTFDLLPGRAREVAPRVRAIVADNPGPFTFKGTVSYIIGRGKVAILDPGPADDAHIAALLDAVRGETVTHIFVTHTHRDHSPAVPKVKAATGATVYAQGPHRLARPLHIGETRRLDASADMDFRPDIALADGEVVSGDGWRMEAVATPGHTANHMAYALAESNLLFSGDHVMAWSTTIVAPPDGAMSDYMASLQKLAHRDEATYLPGHGGPVHDAPRFVAHCIRHRQGREASVLHRLGKGPADIATLVKAIYIGLDPRLVGAASLSVLAHLEDLTARGLVATEGPPAIGGAYRLAEAPLAAG